MKAPHQILVIFSAFIILTSCHKDQVPDVDNIYHTWEAKTFISLESTGYPKNENKTISLTFNEDGTYSLKLDINSCGGTFEKSNNNNLIGIEPAFCTEICCDSKFSEKLAIMLHEVTSFNIEGQVLKLIVAQWGYIKFELVNSTLLK
jgi:heat shock protein HslJ